MDWNDSPTVKRWIIVLAVFAVAMFLLFTVASKASAQVIYENATSAHPGYHHKTYQAHLARSRATGCRHQWVVRFHQPIYAMTTKLQVDPYVETSWCAGRQYRNVTKLVYDWCGNQGGFFNMDGCKKERGATGYPYLGMHSYWHYTWDTTILTAHKTPEVTFRLYADGHVTGTWYWQS